MNDSTNLNSAHSEVPQPVAAADRAQLDVWKLAIRQNASAELADVLRRTSTIYGQSFGPQSSQPWTDPADRARHLILLLRAVGRSNLVAADAQRDTEPLAGQLFTQIDRDLRNVIPLVTTTDKGLLFQSGYPLGSGPGSLTELSIKGALESSGPDGVLELFSKSVADARQVTIPPSRTSSIEELLRAANSALPHASRAGIHKYLVGVGLLFPHSSPLAPRSQELFEGMSSTTPLKILVDLYTRVRSTNGIDERCKESVLSELLLSIDRSTKGLFASELGALRCSQKLPAISSKIVRHVASLAATEGAEVHAELPEAKILRGMLERCYSAANRGERLSHRTVEIAPRPTGEAVTEEGSQQAAAAVAVALSTLSRNELTRYLTDMVSNGLRDPSSNLSQAFLEQLDGMAITKLLLVRQFFASTANIPEIHEQRVAQRIEYELTQVVPTLKSERLAYLLELCFTTGATESEIATVRAAFRSALHLPPQGDRPIDSTLSNAGLRCWKWIFSELPADRVLLEDLCHKHLPRLMAFIARKIELEVEQGPILDAVLDYASELRLLPVYQPGAEMDRVPLWKAMCLAALVRQYKGESHRVVEAVTGYLTKRILTKGPERHDPFPPRWRELFDQAPVEQICRDVQASISSRTTPLSFEESTYLLTNAHFLARRGPAKLSSLRGYARERFINEVAEAKPDRLTSLSNEALRRVIQGLAAARYRSLALLNPLADACVQREYEFTPREYADLADAFAQLRAGTPALWSSFASHLEDNWDEYQESTLLACVWGLCVAAPNQVPARFNSSVLEKHPLSFALNRVAQSLIALGRYTPRATDRAYRYLRSSQTAEEQHAHERDFMLELPQRIGVSADSIFPQVVVGGFETDFILDFGHRRLIIELDGRGHVLSGPDGGILQGRDAFQDLVFKRLGYEVFHFSLDPTRRGQYYATLRNAVRNLRQQPPPGEGEGWVYCEELVASKRS
jgi:very-short-patch-repair endonuclease